MKRILFFVLMLISIAANSQLMQTNNTPGGYQWVAGKNDSLFIIPHGPDTVNIGPIKYGKSTIGALFFKTTDSTLWIRSAYKWNQITGGGSTTINWGDILGDITNQTDLINYIDSVIAASGGGVSVVTASNTYALSWNITNPTTTPNLTITLDTALVLSQDHFYNSLDSLVTVIASDSDHLTGVWPIIQRRSNDTIYTSLDSAFMAVTLTDGLKSGGIVSWSGSGLTFDVTPALYVIGGVLYQTAAAQITLSDADEDSTRIDVPAVNITPAVIVIEGDPSTNPVTPQPDPATEIALTSITVPAGAIEPGVTVNTIYDQDTTEEWTHTTTATIGFSNTDNPKHLTIAADMSSYTTTRTLTFTHTGNLDRLDYTLLKFYVDLKANMASASNITVRFYNGATAVTPALTITAAQGFTKTDVGYQTITVPLSSLAFSSNTFTRIVWTFTGAGSGLYFDWAQLQGGIDPGGPVTGVSQFSSGNLSPLFTTTVTNPTTTPALSFTASSVNPYTLYGRASGTGVPSFLSSIDSNWIPSLHSQAYYDTRYLTGGGTQDLQSVTDFGNITTHPIFARDYNTWDSTGGVFGSFRVQDGTINLTSNISTSHAVTWRNFNYSLNYNIQNLSNHRDRVIADTGGAEVISVNGKTANTVGAITLATSDIFTFPNTVNKYLNGYGLFVALNSDSLTEGSTNLFYTDARARAAISLTTTGSSGAATYSSSTGVLNVPNYTLAGLGGVSSTLADGKILVGNASNVATAVTPSGDITITNAGVTAIGTNKVLDAMIRQSAGLSVIGRSANTTGDVADITAGSDYNILRRSGTAIGFGSIDLSQSGAVGSSVLPIANGGTNNGSLSVTNGGMAYFDGTKMVALPIGTAAQHLVVVAGVPAWRDTAAVVGSVGWSTTLNTGLSSANAIGTTDAVSFRVKTNNTLRAIMDSVGFLGINKAVPTTYLDVVGDNQLPVFGAEQLSASNWTSINWVLVSGWTYTHTPGNTTALTNTLAGVVGTGYRVLVTVTNRTAGTFTVTFGGVASAAITPSAGTYYIEIPLTATTTGSLSIAPSSTFDGTILISIMAVTGNSTPLVRFANNVASSGIIEFRADSTGSTFIGQNAGARNVSGAGGTTNIAGDNNTAYGYNALALNVSGSQNNAFGSGALALNVNGYQNVAVGSALGANTSGFINTAIGNGALANNTTGQYNMGIGAQAGTGITTAVDNYIFSNGGGNIGNANTRVLIGGRSMSTTLATQSILIDPAASGSYSTGNNNTQAGYQVGQAGGSGTDNSNYGMQAGFRNTGSGGANFGEGAGSTLATGTQSGNFNTSLGFKVNQYATTSTTGTYNVAIGAFVLWPSTSASGQLNIGNVLYGTGLYQTNSGSSTPTTAGALSVGITAPDASALFDLTSTAKGLLIPRMTTAQRTAISSPANYLKVNDTDKKGEYEYRTSTAGWQPVAYGQILADNTADANNTGTGETDLYSYTTVASQLANTGEKLVATYAGTFNDITATGQLQIYFAGTNIGNTGALTVSATGGWGINVIIIRTGSSTARASVSVTTPGASTAVYTAETDLTGLTFTNTNILKITGTAGGAGGGNSDITAKLGTVEWKPAAQ